MRELPPPRSLDMIFDEGVRNLFSQVIGRISVPLFFLISGFLFFYRVDWSWSIYRKKLISRIHTLLVPYVFWNSLVLLFFLFCILSPLGRSLGPNTFEHYSQYSFGDWLRGLWVDRGMGTDILGGPLAYQFWFIRELMVMVVLSPLLYWLVLKLDWFIVVVSGIIWYWTDYHIEMLGLSVTSFFFFLSGAYFSIKQYSLMEKFGRLFLLSFVLYPFLALGDLFTKEYSWNIWIHRGGIVMGILFIFNLSVWLIRRRKIRINTFLMGASFFVYAVHVPILLPFIRKMLYLFIHPENGWGLTLIYFLTVFFVVGIALLLYKFLKWGLPCFTNIITGGR